MILEFCLGWISAIIFLWLLLNKFDSNGTFSSLFFDNKSLRNATDTNPYEESFSELEDIIKKSHTLLKELQLSHFQPKEQQKIPKENINNIPKQNSVEPEVKKEQSQSPKKPIVKGKPSVLRNSLSNGFEEENIIELPLRETTVLIRKINKWHKFHATLTNNLINFSIPNQSTVFAKISLSSGNNNNIELLKKSTLGCISITNKKEAVIQPVSNDTNNEEYGEFLSFFSQINTCILRFKSDEVAEDWVQQITAVLAKGNEDLDDFEGDDLFSSDEFEENGPIEDITEEIKLPEKEKEDVFLAAKNPQEKKALAVFIRELKGVYDPESHDGYTLMRFLRARQLNIPKAIAMFTSYLNWKKEFKPECVTRDMVISEIRKKKGYFHYFDRRKHPSLIVMVGKHVQKDSELSVMLNLIAYILETAIKYMPQSVERFSAIIDCTNLSINQVDFPLVKDGLNILQNYYPERLGGVYITNYPMLFQVVWKVIKPLLDTRTSEKIKFCTPKELLDHYEPKYLPVRLGGTSKFEETDSEIGLETLNDSL